MSPNNYTWIRLESGQTVIEAGRLTKHALSDLITVLARQRDPTLMGHNYTMIYEWIQS